MLDRQRVSYKPVVQEITWCQRKVGGYVWRSEVQVRGERREGIEQ